MEIKKTSKASLENKKSSWLLVGYVIVLVFMFVAFEWSKRDVRIDMSGAITENVFEQEIEIPITEQPELVAPPPPQAPAIAEDNDNVKETAIASSEEIGEAVIIKPISPTVDEEIPVEDEIFEVVEKNPEFSYNGMSLMQYLGKSIKYPTIAQETGTQGRVIVQFVVNKDGSIVDVKVVRGVDPYLDKEAIRVISTMPKWKPGEQRGKPVRCKFTVPVMFKLQ
ncbi:MAG TPA: energy transducer TonB [Bacteroides uniformis]|nr:energy transducer TonB [Bacteroides uniformis]